MKVKDLPDWPPSNFSVTGGPVPTHADQVTIGEVELVQDKSVTFNGTFDGGKPCRCPFFVPDRKTAEKVAKILRNSKGKILLSIANEELPEDQ